MKFYKKIIYCLLVVILIFGSIISVGAEPIVLYGDVTLDGGVTVVDATEISKYLVDLCSFDDKQLLKADFNGDGEINIIDSTDIQKRLASLDYKYVHELYEVEYTNFSADGKTEIPFTVDKSLNIDEYNNETNSYYYFKSGEGSKVDNLFKNYDEYSRFFDLTFDEYNEDFFEDNAIIFLYRYYNVMSTYITLDNAYVKDNVLYLKITQWESSDLQLEITADWNQFITVDKDSVKDVNKICVSTTREYYSVMG